MWLDVQRSGNNDKNNIFTIYVCYIMGFPGGSAVRICLPMSSSAEDAGLIPTLRRFPAEGNGNPL